VQTSFIPQTFRAVCAKLAPKK